MTVTTSSLQHEVRCHKCGYDVRAQPEDGRCPECNAAVAESRRLAALSRRPVWRDCDPRWRRRLLTGVWLLVLLPVVQLMSALKMLAEVPVPSLLPKIVGIHNLGDTLFAEAGIDGSVAFCLGVAFILSKESGRLSRTSDWARRWGVFGCYVVMTLSFLFVLRLASFIAVSSAAMLLSIPPKYQPGITPLFANCSANYMKYGPDPDQSAAEVCTAMSAVLMLLACVALFRALWSCIPRLLAAILVTPLVLLSLANVALVLSSRIAAYFLLDLPKWMNGDAFARSIYFSPGTLVAAVTGRPSFSLLLNSEDHRFPVSAEAVKWIVVFGIAIILSAAEFFARRAERALRSPGVERSDVR